MRKFLKKTWFQQENSGIQYTVLIIVIAVLMLGVLASLLLNTVGLYTQIQQHTINYADDVSAQLASNISSRMRMRGMYVSNLADTFSRMPESVLTEELLKRKAEYLGMEELFILNEDGSSIPASENSKEVMDYLEKHPDIHKDFHIFYTNHGKMFFSAPIRDKNKDDNTLLIGMRTNTVLQKMLQETDFKNQGLSCITDGKGVVIVSATDEAPFRELNDVFNKSRGDLDAEEIQKVIKDVQEQRSGTVQLEDIAGRSLLLCYDFLGINDWMLLTLLSADMFTGGLDIYLVLYVIIIIILMLTMLLIFIYIMWSKRRSVQKIQTIALTDSLTGGKNSLAFQIEGEQLLRKYPQQMYAIIYLNIRKFKRFNERFGVKNGDKILRQVYYALKKSIHDEELLSRTAGDQFYLLIQCDSKEDVLHRLENALELLEKQLSDQFPIDRSCIAQGAYLIPKQEMDFLVLKDRAKVASTYQFDSKTCRFYDDELGKRQEREQHLDDSFKSAIQNHEFKLYLQPKVSPKKNRTNAGEVLVRWEHPDYGLLYPGDFIPLFEQNGKICELDLYMFEETCKLLGGWLAQGRAIPLSVNLSRAHLNTRDLDFLDRFKAIKESYHIPDGLIEIELTESLMLERREVSLVKVMIERIQSIGLQCSIDDFGFGYSSLTLLKDLNVNTIKLDRQFFLSENEKTWIVVQQMISLAHDLGMTVVAEGIEEKEQVERLQQCQCDLIQGYVYAKPMSVSEFQKWIDFVQ